MYVDQNEAGVPHSFAFAANEWGTRLLTSCEGFSRTWFDFEWRLLEVDPQNPQLSVGVGTKAAPLPLVRFGHESALHRIPPQQAKTGLAGDPGLRCMYRNFSMRLRSVQTLKS